MTDPRLGARFFLDWADAIDAQYPELNSPEYGGHMNPIEVLDALIVRDPQPTDVLLLRVADHAAVDQETAAQIVRLVEERMGCKCMILGGGIEVAQFEKETP